MSTINKKPECLEKCSERGCFSSYPSDCDCDHTNCKKTSDEVWDEAVKGNGESVKHQAIAIVQSYLDHSTHNPEDKCLYEIINELEQI